MSFTFAFNQLCRSLQRLRLDYNFTQVRNAFVHPTPKYRPPKWFVRKERVITEDLLTYENRQFINEVVQDSYSVTSSGIIKPTCTPLINAEQENKEPAIWTPRTKRVGLVVKKIGIYPMWLKNGKRVQSTLFQVIDNHTVKYIPPEEYKPKISSKVRYYKSGRIGCMLVGAETIDPTLVTREYAGLFKDTGLLPKKYIYRFMVTPEAALPPGTPLYASHFRAGDVVDVRGLTIDRGFQGVMKRWGFKGMPASHGVTKTHRRGGNIGAGGNKARVWPGTKMPGCMGNRWRILRGVKILRINTKYNVIWTLGIATPGGTGSVSYMFDTVLPLRKLETSPPFPTYVPTGEEPEEYYDDNLHPYYDPTIEFPE